MTGKKTTICLLGASFGTNNMGVNALTAGTLKAFFERYSGGELFLFDYGKQKTTYTFRIGEKSMPVPLVNIRFSKKIYLKNNIAYLIALALLVRCIPFRRMQLKVISRNPWLKGMAEADIVASMAGGDSFSDLYGMRRLLYVSLPQLLALALGKRLVLLPQTIGPFKGSLAKVIAKIILQKAGVVYSRDHAGLEEARLLIGAGYSDERVRFCYDVGFVVDPVKPRSMDLDGFPGRAGRDHPVVGLNVSGLLFMGGYTKRNMFGLKGDYRKLVYDIIEHLIAQKGATVLLVPHVFGAKEDTESDAAVCEVLYADLKQRYPERLYLARGRYDQGEIKYIIGLCDLFIGSRMHACIAALSQNIPAVAIAYSRKFTGVLQTIDAEFSVADPRELENEAVLAVIDRVYEQRTAVRQQLERTMPAVKTAVLELFPQILGAA
jgi:colanic acid/amylovoran biosynthesis protein WcaK/AmsJ